MGKTFVWSLKNGEIEEITISPQDFGLEEHSLDLVCGGDSSVNSKIFLDLLEGKASRAITDFVLMNSAALLLVAGKVDTLKDGVELARESIRSGSAKSVLDRFINLSGNA